MRTSRRKPTSWKHKSLRYVPFPGSNPPLVFEERTWKHKATNYFGHLQYLRWWRLQRVVTYRALGEQLETKITEKQSLGWCCVLQSTGVWSDHKFFENMLLSSVLTWRPLVLICHCTWWILPFQTGPQALSHTSIASDQHWVGLRPCTRLWHL